MPTPVTPTDPRELALLRRTRRHFFRDCGVGLGSIALASLMGRVGVPGRFANWIAPPARGVDNRPLDFEYVRFD